MQTNNVILITYTGNKEIKKTSVPVNNGSF